MIFKNIQLINNKVSMLKNELKYSENYFLKYFNNKFNISVIWYLIMNFK